MGQERVTWVLGTGFSRPLGGPMLNDLLSLRLWRELQVVYRESKYEDLHHAKALKDVLCLYHYGRRFPEGTMDLPNLQNFAGEAAWEEAESFLDYLDRASSDPAGPSNARLRRMFVSTMGHDSLSRPEELSLAAKRHIAAECSYFLHGADLGSEPWIPYIRWATELIQPGDSIINFNYDCVLERLSSYLEEKRGGGYGFSILTPSDADDRWNRRDESTCVLKLHGSTSWRRKLEGEELSYLDTADYEAALMYGDIDWIAIMTPGPGKFAATQELKALWEKSKEALREAAAVVFIGYRFPPSDSAARSELLGAISENKGIRELKLHTVLGPRLDDDTVRLQEMLAYAAQRTRHPNGIAAASSYKLSSHRLWSQDFMSLASRKSLFA